jgi:hypothetical protein
MIQINARQGRLVISRLWLRADHHLPRRGLRLSTIVPGGSYLG